MASTRKHRPGKGEGQPKRQEPIRRKTLVEMGRLSYTYAAAQSDSAVRFMHMEEGQMTGSANYRVICEQSYALGKVERGYTGRSLYVNVDTGVIEERPVTQQMKDVFIGGRGFGVWRLWNPVG